MWFPFVCVSLFLITAVKAREDPYTICPEPDSISPCMCEKKYLGIPMAVIVCKNILTQTTLQEILDKSGDFPFRSAIIQDSSFQYIPHEVFLKNHYVYLTIKNCTLVEILDDELRGIAPLKHLNLWDLKIQKKLTFKNFSNLKRMTLLDVQNTEYKKVKHSDMEWLSRELESISFVNTKTLRIEPNAFKEFKKLNTLRLLKNDIKSIQSNMFPENLVTLILK
ncbi:hypothetical protein TNIN_402961 [Trichonephila inaurata madagascariensis]|uniref:Uncharacterized protein n=1 Tax=Trichonephila inaurata madagascariensis TaxID=2747483 RepID=A0A8X7BXW9_9ARAC|nr:hypothetical protein TNIN_402961 [Trichonephila inaurata madagascariensis]